jgi:protein ATS1
LANPARANHNSSEVSGFIGHMPLLAAGSNSHGQLGDGTLEDQHAWKPVLLRRQVTKVAAGGNHTILLCAGDSDCQTELYGVGDSSRGQLGPFSLSIPTLWDLPDAFRDAVILDIAAAWQTSFVLLRSASADEQTVLASGANDFGLLGCGSNLAERPDWAAVTLTAPQSFKIKRLAASPRHVLVLLDFGASNLKAVYGWGSGRRGELGARNSELHDAQVTGLTLRSDRLQ